MEWVKRLQEQGLDERAIERIVVKKDRLGLADDDPIMALFVEMEWYLKLYREIPEAIAQANESAVRLAQEQAKAAAQETIHGISREISVQTTHRLVSLVRIGHLSALMWASVLLVVVSAVSMATGLYLSGTLPAYFPAELVANNRLLTFVMGCLSAPTYLTLGAVLVSYVGVRVITVVIDSIRHQVRKY